MESRKRRDLRNVSHFLIKAVTVSRGIVYSVVLRLVFFGMAGLVRSGGFVEARTGRRGGVGSGLLRPVWVRSGRNGRVRSVEAAQGGERLGTAGKAVYVTVLQGKVRGGRYGRFRTVAVGRGMVWQARYG